MLPLNSCSALPSSVTPLRVLGLLLAFSAWPNSSQAICYYLIDDQGQLQSSLHPPYDLTYPPDPPLTAAEIARRHAMGTLVIGTDQINCGFEPLRPPEPPAKKPGTATPSPAAPTAPAPNPPAATPPVAVPEAAKAVPEEATTDDSAEAAPMPTPSEALPPILTSGKLLETLAAIDDALSRKDIQAYQQYLAPNITITEISPEGQAQTHTLTAEAYAAQLKTALSQVVRYEFSHHNVQLDIKPGGQAASSQAEVKVRLEFENALETSRSFQETVTFENHQGHPRMTAVDLRAQTQLNTTPSGPSPMSASGTPAEPVPTPPVTEPTPVVPVAPPAATDTAPTPAPANAPAAPAATQENTPPAPDANRRAAPPDTVPSDATTPTPPPASVPPAAAATGETETSPPNSAPPAATPSATPPVAVDEQQVALVCAKVTEIPVTECQTLARFYFSTGGAGWKAPQDWLQNNSPCTWGGVTCAAGRVVALQRSANQLQGVLPELSALSELQRLTLFNNQLSGALPDLSGLKKLQWINLSRNAFTGPLPALAALTQLEELRAHHNQLRGPLPSFSGLSRLKVIELHKNQLDGSIPELQGLSALEELNLSDNPLSGALPNLDGLTQLSRLAIYNTQLSGTLPALNRLTNLKNLNLAGNRLNGPLPDFSGLLYLESVNVGGNLLHGPLPASLGTLINLKWLQANDNALFGPLPDLSGAKRLQTLNLQNNQFCGEVPAWLRLSRLNDARALLKLEGNHLQASDAATGQFLDQRNPGWRNAQTALVGECQGQ